MRRSFTATRVFRDRLLNSAYLPNEVAGLHGYPVGIDAYTAAFTVPDFMFFILVSGALSVTFIPVFNQRLASGNKKSAWELSTSLLNFMAILTLITSLLIIIFAEPLIRYLIAPGFDESTTALAVSTYYDTCDRRESVSVCYCDGAVECPTSGWCGLCFLPLHLYYTILVLLLVSLFLQGVLQYSASRYSRVASWESRWV